MEFIFFLLFPSQWICDTEVMHAINAPNNVTALMHNSLSLWRVYAVHCAFDDVMRNGNGENWNTRNPMSTCIVVSDPRAFISRCNRMRCACTVLILRWNNFKKVYKNAFNFYCTQHGPHPRAGSCGSGSSKCSLLTTQFRQDMMWCSHRRAARKHTPSLTELQQQ